MVHFPYLYGLEVKFEIWSLVVRCCNKRKLNRPYIWPLSTLIELKNSLSIFQMSFFFLAVVLLISTSYVSSVFDLHTECNTWAFEDNQCIENPKYAWNHIIIRTFEFTSYFLTNQQLYVDFLPHELHKLREKYCWWWRVRVSQ